MPGPLWSGGYNPYIGWTKIFQLAMPKMIAASGNTDRFLESVKQEWIDHAAAARERARSVLGMREATGS